MNELCRKRYAITRWFMQDPIKCFSLLRGHLILSFSNVIYNSNCCVSATPLLLIYYVNGLFVYQFLRLVALSHTDYMACYGVWTYLYIYIYISESMIGSNICFFYWIWILIIQNENEMPSSSIYGYRYRVDASCALNLLLPLFCDGFS